MIRRLLMSVLVLFGISIIAFSMIHARQPTVLPILVEASITPMRSEQKICAS